MISIVILLSLCRFVISYPFIKVIEKQYKAQQSTHVTASLNIDWKLIICKYFAISFILVIYLKKHMI